MITVHPNYIKSSNLTLITLPLGLINILLSDMPIDNVTTITALVFTIIIILGIAYLLRQGYEWMKIVLLVLFILGIVIAIPTWLKMMEDTPINFAISIIQTAIQAWVIVLLFKIPKLITEKSSDLPEPL